MDIAIKVMTISSVVVGVPLNLTILLVRCGKYVKTRWKCKSIYEFYVCQLALTDLLFATLTIFDVFSNFNNHKWEFGLASCKIFRTLQSMCITSSAIFMTVMAYERHYGITHALVYQGKVRRLVIATTATWLYSILSFVPSILAHDLYYEQCAEVKFPSDAFRKAYGLFHGIFDLLIPLVVTFLFHLKIIFHIKKHHQIMCTHQLRLNLFSLSEIEEEEEDHQSVTKDTGDENICDDVLKSQTNGRRHSSPFGAFRRRKSIPIDNSVRLSSRTIRHSRKLKIRILMAISVCYFLLVGPASIWYICLDHGLIDLTNQSTNSVITFLICLMYFHCCTNGIIYSVADRRFRRDIKITLDQLFRSFSKQLQLRHQQLRSIRKNRNSSQN